MSASYPVRTPLLYWAVVGALVVLALFGAAAFVLGLTRGGFALIDVLALLLVAVPIVYIATTAEYRATGTIHLAPREAVVPDPRGRPLTFTGPNLRISATPVSVRLRINLIPVGEFDRGALLEFADDRRVRRISTLALVRREHKDALLADLDRILRGEDPHGPHLQERPPAPPRAKSELEAQLDRELAALD